MAGPVAIEATTPSGGVVTTTYLPGAIRAVRVTPAASSSYDVAVLTAAGWEAVANLKGDNAKQARAKADAFAAVIVHDASEGDAPAAQYAELRKP